MLFDLIRGGHSMLEILAGVFASLFVVFCTLPFHEYPSCSATASSKWRVEQ